MSSSTKPRPPFWTSRSPKPPRLRGTHASLLAAAEDGARVHAYSQTQRYAVGELLLHGVFGLGVVVEALSPGRVTVRFEDRDRLLACGSR